MSALSPLCAGYVLFDPQPVIVYAQPLHGEEQVKARVEMIDQCARDGVPRVEKGLARFEDIHLPVAGLGR